MCTWYSAQLCRGCWSDCSWWRCRTCLLRHTQSEQLPACCVSKRGSLTMAVLLWAYCQADFHLRPHILNTTAHEWNACRCIVPIGVLFAVTLWMGNAAYLYLSVSFIQMLKVSDRHRGSSTVGLSKPAASSCRTCLITCRSSTLHTSRPLACTVLQSCPAQLMIVLPSVLCPALFPCRR